MSDLSIEDFKNVLLDLYLSQRENAGLRSQLAEERQARDGTLTDRNGEEI